jgi:predicted transcriptional regulator
MATITVSRGPIWGKHSDSGIWSPEHWSPVTGWGAERLGDVVRTRFQEIAARQGSSAQWIPERSEVIADLDEQRDWEADLLEWLFNAANWVTEHMGEILG